MPTNYLKIFVTQIMRNKLLALINVAGLAAGLASCILIALFVGHELRYDSFFRNADDIHRLSFQVAFPDNTLSMSSVPGPLGPLLEEVSPQVRTATRLEERTVRLQAGELLFRQENFNLVDKNFFTVFDLDWLRGNTAQAFTSPNAVILTESMARQYFGNLDPIGSTLLMDDETMLTVTGVIADLPSNTHLTGRAFASFDLLELLIDDPAAYLGDWWGSFYTYVVLAPGAGIAELEAQLANLFEQYAEMPPWLPPGTTITLGTIPVTDIHMKSHNIDELRPGGSMVIVYAFTAIGIGILAIAGINFVNITTAWASRRAREVGVREVLGGTRQQLAWQFIVEALLLCSLAMMLALACVELLLPTLNALLATDLQLGLGNLQTAGLLMLATLVLGLLAGWYPSLYLSAFRPSAVLKGSTSASTRKRSLSLSSMFAR